MPLNENEQHLTIRFNESEQHLNKTSTLQIFKSPNLQSNLPLKPLEWILAIEILLLGELL